MKGHIPLILVVCAMLAGCDKHVTQAITVADASSARECATRAAGERFYAPAQNAAKDGTPRLARPLFGRDGDPPQDGPPDEWQLQDYLTITTDGSSLRIAAVGTTIGGKELTPSPRTLEHVREIMARCASSP